MSEMASWFQTHDGVIFLTDDDVKAYHDQSGQGVRDIAWNDFVGHSGLMKVFNLPNNHEHREGFVDMPDVIRKTALEGKMDMIFAHAGNLSEATHDFIPLMKRLANRFPHVKRQLSHNPYKNYTGGPLTNVKQMEIGVKNHFKGSTIGKLLRQPLCGEESMLVALKGARELMDMHSDHHHYFDILNHPNVTKKVIKYIIDNTEHFDVVSKAKDLLCWRRFKKNINIKNKTELIKLKVKTIRKGKAKIRMAV